MSQLKVFYSDLYTLPLPEGHRFPMSKYRLLREYLLSEQILSETELEESPEASPELLALAHDQKYIEQVRTCTLPREIEVRIGFPQSPELYRRSCATVGGLFRATENALKYGVSGNLAGGTHHAHFDRGEGYCVFNDIAVVTRYLKTNHLAQRIAILDLDVHQGNGNSSILSEDEGVFVVSVHGEKNYPFKKVPSHLDLPLPDNCGDEAFLAAVEKALAAVLQFEPDFVFYQMGVDALFSDRLGKLKVSFEALEARDELVLETAKSRAIPIALALGGGYADPITDSVKAYANTYRMVKRVYFPR